MEFLSAHCSAFIASHHGVLLTFFLGGLAGSVTHCAGMCGSMVACRSMCSSETCGDKRSKMQLPYHLGRLTTYGGLGFVAGLLGNQLVSMPIWSLVSAVLLVVAGVMFIVSSLPVCLHHLRVVSAKLGYAQGMLLGFLPCGLLYAALMMAAATGKPLIGMVAMWAFVLGTMPVLLLASAGAGFLSQTWQNAMPKIGRVMMAFNGIFLLITAERLVR